MLIHSQIEIGLDLQNRVHGLTYCFHCILNVHSRHGQDRRNTKSKSRMCNVIKIVKSISTFDFQRHWFTRRHQRRPRFTPLAPAVCRLVMTCRDFSKSRLSKSKLDTRNSKQLRASRLIAGWLG